ncbi:MAG: hypothetical protein Tsb0020_07760 [Haliangiales bacterium]
MVVEIAAILARRWSLELRHGDAPSGADATTAEPRVVALGGGRYQLAVTLIADGHSFGCLTCGELVGAPDAQTRSHAADLLALAASEVVSCVRERGLLRRTEPDAQPARSRYADIIGASAPMQALYSILDRVVKSDSTVLIQGENGTGKELVARAIHDLSPRSRERFVVTNCSAFQDNLLDSELFGHVKGAFTGAVVDKPGLFESADRGTFFLDEIGDMSPALQVKVLRVLQEGTYTPVGSTEQRQVDVRVLAATNRDLEQMVKDGRFREDLYYRVNVISLHIPPLRERPGDVELLIEHFLGKHQRARQRPKSLSPACRQLLLAHPWPGNVRELENEIERLVVFAGNSPDIDESMLSRRVRRVSTQGTTPATAPQPAPQSPQSGPHSVASSLPDAMRALERRMILQALEHHDWNKTRAAAALSVSRRNLIRLVQKYDLDAERPA